MMISVIIHILGIDDFYGVNDDFSFPVFKWGRGELTQKKKLQNWLFCDE